MALVPSKVQMSYFACAESYANEGEQRIFSFAFDSARA